MNNIKTPELDKILEIREQSQICGEFLEFLQKNYAMFDLKVPRKEPFYQGAGDYINTEKVLAEFFGIDLDIAEKERKMLLNKVYNGDK